MELSYCLAHLLVCVCVCSYVCQSEKIYCGITADWIRMSFGMVNGVGRGISALDGGGNCQRGKGSVGDEFGAFHYNQWGLFAVV